MTNIQNQALAILQGLFGDVHCEEVHGGVHGGEHYLAGSFTHRGMKRVFLLRIDGIDDKCLKPSLAPIVRSLIN